MRRWIPLLLLLTLAAPVHPSRAADRPAGPRCDGSRAGQLHALKGWCGVEARKAELSRRQPPAGSTFPEKDTCEPGSDRERDAPY